jgi:vanillate O-demethylase monooxygenase subunit
LLIDNLMDLTHEAFLHSTTIGNHAVAEAPFAISQEGDTVVLTRWVLNAEPPPLWASRLGKPGPVDRWQIIRFEAPSIVILDVGVAPAGTGAPQGDRSAGINGCVMHAITPETDGSCHLFWNNVRNYRTDDERLTQAVYDTTEPIIAEDRDILEAQQAALDADLSRKPHNLHIDAAAVRARRLIDRMVALEAGQ